jgi:acyl transferase domain-containing protein
MTRPFQPIAVVAADCLLPGAPDLKHFWAAMNAGVSAIDTVPESWMDRSVLYSPDPAAANRSYSQTAALVAPWSFTKTPRVPPKQLQKMDETHKVVLELGQRLVDKLGPVWLPRRRTGAWIANVAGAYDTNFNLVTHHASQRWAKHLTDRFPDLTEQVTSYQSHFLARQAHPPEDLVANSNILSGRVANYFDLGGPQMSIDAACASSFAALRSACLALEFGDCDLAFVGAVAVLRPEMMVVTSKARAISPGFSSPFDRDASGYVPGEGSVMVALARLEDVEERGLAVLGVVRSIGTSLNGRATSSWSPSETAEIAAIRRAWAEGGLSEEDLIDGVDYVEAHGTATPVGDAMEHQAMLATYGQCARRAAIPFGSVKSMIGHTVETAGLAGLLRALYMFASHRLPPTVGGTSPASFVAEHQTQLVLARHNVPFEPAPGRTVRAGVSSFGYGGINYHAIVESGPDSVAVPGTVAVPGPEKVRRRDRREPIAVVARAGVMPGAEDTEAIWRQLASNEAPRTSLHDYIPDFELFFDGSAKRRDQIGCPVSAVVATPTLHKVTRWRVLPNQARYLFSDHVLLLNAVDQLVDQGVLPTDEETKSRSGVFISHINDSDSCNQLFRILGFEQWWSGFTKSPGGRSCGDLSTVEKILREDPVLGLRDITESDSMAGQGVFSAARIASVLDLGGRAVAVNSACASGLAAVYLAAQELRAGTLDFAIVAGASIAIDESNQTYLSAIGALSPSGCQRPYDRAADGFVIGTGAIAFGLKRLADAESDGDVVHAVIRECCGNSDGAGTSLLAPNDRGRREILQTVYRQAGVSPTTVQYVEGHGASIPLGDTSEIGVLAEVMGACGRPVWLGSVKGNYGHLKSAAGLAALLKTVLCLEHRMLVPTPGHRHPGVDEGLSPARVKMVNSCRPWPANGDIPRRAAVTAFGLGGTNFHAILDEFESAVPVSAVPVSAGPEHASSTVAEAHGGSPSDGEAAPRPQLLRAGAAAATDLTRQLLDRSHGTAGAAEGGGPTAGSRDAHRWRAGLALPANLPPTAVKAAIHRFGADLVARPAGAGEVGYWAGPDVLTGPVLVMFAGQSGLHYLKQISWLARNLPDADRSLRDIVEVLGEPGHRVRCALHAQDPDLLGDLRDRSGTSQLLALWSGHAVWEWMRDRLEGTEAVLLGHSVGEVCALLCAGSLTFPDAVRVVWERGRCAEEVWAGRSGAMATVFASPERVERLVTGLGDVHIATTNSPTAVVVAGERKAVEAVLKAARAAGLNTTLLDVRIPCHTPLLADAVPVFRTVLQSVEVRPPHHPVYSCSSGEPYPRNVTPGQIRDCLADLYVRPVHFDRMVQRAEAGGVRRFIECGVGHALSRWVSGVLEAAPVLAIPGITATSGPLERLELALWVAALDQEPTPPGREPVAGPAAAQPLAGGRPNRTVLATTVALPRSLPQGRPWSRTRVTVVQTGSGPLAEAYAGALRAAGAEVQAVSVAELTCDTGAERLPVEQVARLVGPAAGDGHWLVWVAGTPGPSPALSSQAGARVVTELDCLRTVVAALLEGWQCHGFGGLLLATSLDGRFGTTPCLFDPSAGALTGFARALSHEIPQAAITVVDVLATMGLDDAVRRLCAAGRSPAGYHEVGLAGTQYLATELVPLAVTPDTAPGGSLLQDLLDPEAVVLVSGGTTGILAHTLCSMAECLPQPPAGRLVLVSRTPASEEPVPDLAATLHRLDAGKREAVRRWRHDHPDRSLVEFETRWRRRRQAFTARATLDRLTDLGIQVQQACLDVADTEAVQALGERLCGRVTTVVHGAGLQRAVRFPGKPRQEWLATLATKVTGVHNMVQAAGPGLRRLIIYGSVSGTLGMPGDTDYSAANEYLARYATRLRAERPELDVLCVGWPAWDEVGLAADPTIKRRLERRGMRYLPPDEGVAWTAAVTGTSASLPAQVVVLPVPLPEPAASTVSARVDDVPAVDWWLIDSMVRHGSGATVLREYRTNDPRDVELVDHQIADRLRIAGVQILEQFLEAFLCLHPLPADSIELRDVTLHQGFVIGPQGRRQVSVHVTPPAADDVSPGDLADVRLETRPVLPEDIRHRSRSRSPPAGSRHAGRGVRIPWTWPLRCRPPYGEACSTVWCSSCCNCASAVVSPQRPRTCPTRGTAPRPGSGCHPGRSIAAGT